MPTFPTTLALVVIGGVLACGPSRTARAQVSPARAKPTAHEQAVERKEQAAWGAIRQRAATQPIMLPTAPRDRLSSGHAQDLVVPPVETGEPAAGKRVRYTLPEYDGTDVYGSLYLPTDWRPGVPFPVIVEYQGNGGAVDVNGAYDAALGFGQSAGKGFIWLCLPYVNEEKTSQQLIWWGDVPATLDFCRRAVRDVCERYGGDGSAVLLTGFSRGAIACNFLGLHDDPTADLWLAFLPHSHYEGKWPGSTPADRPLMLQRLARLKGRASFVTNEGPEIFPYAKETIEQSDAPFTLVPLPDVRHTNTWVLEDCPQRATLRAWLSDVLKNRPGTYDVTGRVTDASGFGIAGVRIEAGFTRWTYTLADGSYTLRSLPDLPRTLIATKDGVTFVKERIEMEGLSKDVRDVDFVVSGR